MNNDPTPHDKNVEQRIIGAIVKGASVVLGGVALNEIVVEHSLYEPLGLTALVGAAACAAVAYGVRK